MEYLGKKPIESFIFLIIFYFNISVFLFARSSFEDKFEHFLLSLLIFLFMAAFSFAYRDILKKIEENMAKMFMTIRKNKGKGILSILTPLFLYGLFSLLLVTIIESVLFVVVNNTGLIAIGFPFSFYSFSARILIIPGLIFDLVLYMSLILFLGYAVSNERKLLN